MVKNGKECICFRIKNCVFTEKTQFFFSKKHLTSYSNGYISIHMMYKTVGMFSLDL